MLPGSTAAHQPAAAAAGDAPAQPSGQPSPRFLARCTGRGRARARDRGRGGRGSSHGCGEMRTGEQTVGAAPPAVQMPPPPSPSAARSFTLRIQDTVWQDEPTEPSACWTFCEREHQFAPPATLREFHRLVERRYGLQPESVSETGVDASCARLAAQPTASIRCRPPPVCRSTSATG